MDTLLFAKLKVISQDIDDCVRGDDANHGNISMTLRAMRLSADHSMYCEKNDLHQTHPWYS